MPAAALKLETPTTPLSVRDPVEMYLATLPSRSSRRTMRSKLGTVQRLLEKRIEANDLLFFALAARASLQDAGAAPKTINVTLSALKGVARYAWLMKLITAEDLERVKDIRSVRGSRLPAGRAHYPAELEAILEACARDRSPAGARDAAMIALAYNLGLRRSECAGLNLDDYSPTTGIIRVRGKGNKERRAYVVDKGAIEALAAWLRVRTFAPGPLLCPVTRHGRILLRRLSDNSVYLALRKRARSAGITDLTPHNLRRTFGTKLLDSGVDIKIARDLLGHSNLNTTTLYDRRAEETYRAAASQIRLPYHDQRQPELPFENEKSPRAEAMQKKDSAPDRHPVSSLGVSYSTATRRKNQKGET